SLLVSSSIVLTCVWGFQSQQTQQMPQGQETQAPAYPPPVVTAAEFDGWMKERSNWGRWGNDDELGAANLITVAKRKQALALAKEGLPISLAHDIPQEQAADAPNILQRTLAPVTPGGTADQYTYTGTYHGIVHSH